MSSYEWTLRKSRRSNRRKRNKSLQGDAIELNSTTRNIKWTSKFGLIGKSASTVSTKQPSRVEGLGKIWCRILAPDIVAYLLL